MRKPTRQEILGDWSGTTWLYALACLACIFFLEALVVVYMIPSP